MRVLAVVAGLLALLALAWAFGSTPTTPPVEAATSTPPDDRSIEPANATLRDGEPVPPVPAAAPERLELDESPAATLAGPRVRGTFIVADADGRTHATEAGRFALLILRDGVRHQVEVDVRRGVWTAPIEPGDRLTASDCILADRAVVCDGPALEVRDDVAPAFRGRWLPHQMLRVRAADTRADLSGIRIVRVRDWTRDNFPHPGNADDNELILQGATSPLALPDPTTRFGDRTTVWVHAPGYAWDKLVVSLTDRVEREIFLERGGDLEVTIVGGVPRDAVLRAWGLSGSPPLTAVPAAEFTPPVDGPLRIEGLKPGDYRIRCDKGHWFQEPLVLGSTDTTVVAGERRTVAVTITGNTVAPPLVPVAGTVHLPASWERQGLTLEFDPIGATQSWMRDSKRIRATVDLDTPWDLDIPWDAGKLHAGDYQVIVTPVGTRARLTVGQAGATDVRIIVAEAADVRLRLLEQDSGRTVTSGTLNWFSELPAGVSGWSPATAKLDAATSTFRFRAPSGRVHLGYGAGSRDYQWTNATRDLQPGLNELTLEVVRACGIDVVFTDRGVAVPSDDWRVELRRVDGDGGVASKSGARISAKAPGRYEVEFPEINGYRPIPPRTVTIEPGQWVEVKVALERL